VELWWGSTHLEVLHGPAAATLRGGPGDTVSLLPLHGGVSGIVTEGLRFPLDAEELPAGSSRGVSNVVEHAPATVRVALGTLLVIHPPPTGATT
jgi:thiamine pyrophosphokinase